MNTSYILAQDLGVRIVALPVAKKPPLEEIVPTAPLALEYGRFPYESTGTPRSFVVQDR